jgi:hypothetical protein
MVKLFKPCFSINNMNFIQIVLVIIVSLLGYPIGLLLAELTKEELKSGRSFFKIIMFLSLAALVLSFLFLKGGDLVFFIAIMIFIFLLTLASFIKTKKSKK